MKPVPLFYLVGPVPIRVGALLRLIRGLSGKKVLDILEEYYSGEDREEHKQLSTATWSTYETGSRTVGEPGAQYLNQMVNILLENSISQVYDTYPELFETYGLKKSSSKIKGEIFDSLYYKEKLLLSLSDFFPLRYIGAAVLSKYLFDINETDDNNIYPEDSNKYLDISKISAEIIVSWLKFDKCKEFRSLFSKWLIFENRFISKFNANPNYSILRADKYFSSKKGKGYKAYDNLFQFYSDFIGGGLFFEHIGPAIDAIFAFSKKIEISDSLNKISLTVENIAGDDKVIESYAYWTEVVD